LKFLSDINEKELKKWSRKKKEELINKKNPEWKELVTESGFVRKKQSFSQQVNALVNGLLQNTEASSSKKGEKSKE